MSPEIRQKSLLLFYKPLSFRGGDVDEFRRLINDLSAKSEVLVLIFAPFFWLRESKRYSLGSGVEIREICVDPITIFINVFKMIIRLLPMEFALFFKPIDIPYHEYDNIICRGSRVMFNVPAEDKSRCILVLADSLGITWYRRSKFSRQPISCFKRLYAAFHLNAEYCFAKSAKVVFLFDALEVRFLTQKYDCDKFKYSRMAWENVTPPLDHIEADPNMVSVFGVHGAKHNSSRLENLISYAPKNRDFKFVVVGSLENLSVKVLHELSMIENIQVVGFLDSFEDVIRLLKQCKYSYHHYSFTSGMQNTVLLAANLGQVIICDHKTRLSIAAYFDDNNCQPELISPYEVLVQEHPKGRTLELNVSYLEEFGLR